MEYQPTTIWSRLLTKRQRSSLSPFSDLSKAFGFSDNQKTEQFFFNQAIAEPNLIAPEPQKKVKLSQNSPELAFVTTNLNLLDSHIEKTQKTIEEYDQIDIETVKGKDDLQKQASESPCTRVDEFSPNLTSFFTPPIKFNDNLLGSPANYDLDRY